MRWFYLFLLLPTLSLHAQPLKDQQSFRLYYQKLFPSLTLKDYADGVYAIDPISRESWLAIEEFPPYELAIEEGQRLFKIPFKNGKSYADCFENGGIAIMQNYPLWDDRAKQVVTLAKAINDCRTQNHELSLAYKKGEIAKILAYMAYTSRGQLINIKIPNNPQALAAYEQGKAYYYQRRGQLNFSCASCHVQNAGKRLRAEYLSPALGHTSNWPTYRLKWGEMGTLHRRFISCHKQIRAKPPKAQSVELRDLEYFLTFMGNGIPINAPSTRR